MTKLALIHKKVVEISLNNSRNYITERNKILYKPILSDKIKLKKNELTNSLQFNNFIKNIQLRNNTLNNKKKCFSLDLNENNKLNNKKFEMKDINYLSINLNNSNIPKINIKNSNCPNFKLLRFNNLNFYDNKLIDNNLYSSSSQKEINEKINNEFKFYKNNSTTTFNKKRNTKNNEKNIFRNNKHHIKLSINVSPESNFKTQRNINDYFNQISTKKIIESQFDLNQNNQNENKDIITINVNKEKKEKRNKSVENMVKRVLYGTSKTIDNNIENKISDNNNYNKINYNKTNSILNNININNINNNVLSSIKVINNQKSIIKYSRNNKKSLNKKHLEISFSDPNFRNHLIKQFPKVKIKNKKIPYKKYLIHYLKSQIKNKINDDNTYMIKKSKLLIEEKLSLIKSNQLYVKNPYKEIHSYLKELQTEFISNLIILYEDTIDIYFIEKNFVPFFKNNLLMNCFQNYLKKIYFDYKEKLLEYLFYGEKIIHKNYSFIKPKYTSKSVAFFCHVDLQIENQVFINKLFLRDYFDLKKRKIKKIELSPKKSPKHIQKRMSDLLIKNEMDIQKTNAFHFHRILHKIENLSILTNKNNLKRENKNIANEKIINSDSVFRSLSFFTFRNNIKQFVRFFEQFKDLIDIEKTDDKYNTLLTLSVKFHSFEICKFLIEKGANINTQNIYLNTPLHYAFASKLYKFIDLLISKGADENIKNIYGQTCTECINIENEEI